MEEEQTTEYDDNSQNGNSDNKVPNVDSSMSTIEMMKCSICKNFVPRFDIRTHTEEHFENFTKHHICDFCGRNFRDGNLLRLHMKIHGEKTYHCEFCDKSFFSKQSLNVHESAKHTKKGFKFCDNCGQSFSTRRGLESHMKLKHKIENRFQCNLCRKYFLTEEGLKAHDIRDDCKNIKCDKCGKHFHSKKSLSRHMNGNNDCSGNSQEQKQFPCHLCGSSYTRLYQLKEHFKKKHDDNYEEEGHKPFVCHCGKAFSKETNLTKHQATHIQEFSSHPGFHAHTSLFSAPPSSHAF